MFWAFAQASWVSNATSSGGGTDCSYLQVRNTMRGLKNELGNAHSFWNSWKYAHNSWKCSQLVKCLHRLKTLTTLKNAHNSQKYNSKMFTTGENAHNSKMLTTC